MNDISLIQYLVGECLFIWMTPELAQVNFSSEARQRKKQYTRGGCGIQELGTEQDPVRRQPSFGICLKVRQMGISCSLWSRKTWISRKEAQHCPSAK